MPFVFAAGLAAGLWIRSELDGDGFLPNTAQLAVLAGGAYLVWRYTR